MSLIEILRRIKKSLSDALDVFKKRKIWGDEWAELTASESIHKLSYKLRIKEGNKMTFSKKIISQ